MPKLGSGKPAPARFWSKVKKNRRCWLWTAAVDKDGYGKFQINPPGGRQKHVRAHRYSFFLAHGRWPRLNTRHVCDTPNCVRPDHLLEGTQKQNRADCVERGREPRGERKTTAVLTEAIVRKARLIRENGARGDLGRFADKLGVKRVTIYAAATRRNWKYLR